MPYMTRLTEAAQLIGAVNTVTALSDGEFEGDNTDWLGIANSLHRHGVPQLRASHGSPVSGLVVGGGGTSRAAIYALHQMGCATIYLANRTSSKLHELKSEFPPLYNLQVVDSLSDLELAAPVSVAVSTVPADKPLDPVLLSKVKVLLAKTGGLFTPTLLEAAYKPRFTPMMQMARDEYGWKVVPGADMLVNQGVEQFVKWTGFEAPYDEIYALVTAE